MPNLDHIDDTVLALLLLGLHNGDCVWKSMDWDAMERLHEKGLITNPVGKAKSVAFTPEGKKRAEELFDTLFGENAPEASAPGDGLRKG